MIPFDKFGDIEYIVEGGFVKVYSATWIDGEIEKSDQAKNKIKKNCYKNTK